MSIYLHICCYACILSSVPWPYIMIVISLRGLGRVFKETFYEVVPLTLIQLGSGKSINYQGPFSFDLAFTRCKLTSPGIWQMCKRALRFQESTQSGCGNITTLRKSERPARLRTTSPALCTARDQKLIGMLTATALHCEPRPGGTSPVRWSVLIVKQVGSRKVSRVMPQQNFWQKTSNGHQNVIFWHHVRSLKRLARRFCRIR